jgi:O-antigen/teichoic acid export membrane protein
MINKLSKDILSVFSTKLGLLVFRTLFSIIIARTLGPEGKGIYVAILTFAATTVNICSFGLTESLIYHTASGFLSSRYMRTILILSVVISLFSLIVMYLLKAPIIEHIFTDIPKDIYNYSYAFIFLLVYNNLFASILKGKKNFKIFNIISIVLPIARLTSLLILLAFSSLEVDHYIQLAIFILILNAIFATAYLNWYINESVPQAICGKYTTLVKYGIKTYVGSLLSQIEYQFDIFIMLAFMSPSAIGYYSISYSTALLMRYITNSINNVLFPEISSQKNRETALVLQNKILRINLLLNLVAAVLIAVFAYPLIYIGYGDEFSVCYYLLLIMLPGIWIDSLFRTLLTWYKANNAPQVSSMFTLVSLIVNIVLFYFFIPIYGIWGAAISISLTFSTRSVLIIIYYTRKEHIKLRSVILISLQELNQLWTTTKQYKRKYIKKIV